MQKENTDIPHVKQDVNTLFTLLPLNGILAREQAHRHDFYVLVYVQEGFGMQHIDYEEIPVVSQRLHFIAPHKVHLWRGKCEGYAMMISASFIKNISHLLDALFIDLNNDIYIDIPSKEQKQISMLMDILANIYYTQESSLDLIRSLVQSFLYYCFDLKEQTVKTPHAHLDTRLLEVKQLVEQHYKEDCSTQWYAQKLILTSQHLNRLLKEHTGKTLTQLIKERKVLEAKRELIFTDKSIDSIGASLGFFDSSNFSKYFKNQTTLSPKYFREMFKYYH